MVNRCHKFYDEQSKLPLSQGQLVIVGWPTKFNIASTLRASI